MTTIQLGGVTIDCADPRTLAAFWTEALGFTVVADYDGEFMFLAPEGQDSFDDHVGRRPYVGLQRVAEAKAGKARLHMDFNTDDRPAEVARLVALGATAVDEQAMPGLSWTVLRDPEGNEFCVGSTNG